MLEDQGMQDLCRKAYVMKLVDEQAIKTQEQGSMNNNMVLLPRSTLVSLYCDCLDISDSIHPYSQVECKRKVSEYMKQQSSRLDAMKASVIAEARKADQLAAVQKYMQMSEGVCMDFESRISSCMQEKIRLKF
jgi:hypothetical protein